MKSKSVSAEQVGKFESFCYFPHWLEDILVNSGTLQLSDVLGKQRNIHTAGASLISFIPRLGTKGGKDDS